MTNNVILAILGLSLQVFGYLIWFHNVYGFWPTSYSDTFRHWENTPTKSGKDLDAGYRFTAWVAIAILFMLPGLLALSTTKLQARCAYLALFYLGLVGVYPSGIDKLTTKWHCRFAKACAALAIIWLLLQRIYVATGIILVVSFIWSRLWQRKYETLIMEMAAFISVYVGILILS